MRFYLIAFQFLTIIPLPFRVRCEQEDLGRSTPFFPLIGLTIGCLLAGLDWLVASHLTRQLTDALLITALAAVTGALHLDGLADVCDGMAARGGRERFLEVMKDSHVGAVGVVGIVLGVVLKWQALAGVPEAIKWQALLLFPLLARFSQVLAMAGARHARQDGLGSLLIKEVGMPRLGIATALTAPIAWLLLGDRGIVALAVIIVLTIAVRVYFSRRLGGLTGDILGFLNEVNEIVGLIAVSIVV